MPLYSPHYDQIITSSGPKRSVELPYYKDHVIHPPFATVAPIRRHSVCQRKRTNKEGRSKSRPPKSEETQVRAPKTESRLQAPVRVRQLADGSWEYIYPEADSNAPPRKRRPRKDINDPATYIRIPNPDEVSSLNWLPADVEPVADEEAIISDDSGEYDVNLEYQDPSDRSQPSATIIQPSVVDWNDEPQLASQLEEISDHHYPYRRNPDYRQSHHAEPKPSHTNTKHKRRNSFAASPPQKPSRLSRFFFPQETRVAVKQGTLRDGRIVMWLEAHPPEYDRNINLQSEEYSAHEDYRGATSPEYERGYAHGYAHRY